MWLLYMRAADASGVRKRTNEPSWTPCSDCTEERARVIGDRCDREETVRLGLETLGELRDE